MKPSFSRPIKFVAGITTRSRWTDPRPAHRPPRSSNSLVLMPGRSRGTRKALIPRAPLDCAPVRAQTIANAACAAKLVDVLSPARLGQRGGRNELARQHPAQPGRDDRRISVPGQDRAAQRYRHHQLADVVVGAADGLEGETRCRAVKAAAAILFRELYPEESEVAHRPQCRAVERTLLLALLVIRSQLPQIGRAHG